MKIEFRRECGGNYLILVRSIQNDFRERMLVENSIRGLLPVYIRNINDESYYYYDIHSKQSLKSLVMTREISGDEIKVFLGALAELHWTLKEFFLIGQKIVLMPEAIMISPQNFMPAFCYYPDNDIPEEAAYLELAELMIQNICNDDSVATELAYGYYESVMAGQYNPRELLDRILIEEGRKTEHIVGEMFGEYREDDAVINDSYYFTETVIEEETVNRFVLVPMGICAGLILIAGTGYITFYLNTDILDYFGVARESYIVAGAILAGVLAIVLVAIFHTITRQKKKRELQEALEEENADRIPISVGRMELMEYEHKELQNNSFEDDTVYFDHVEIISNLRTEKRLVGKADDQNIEIVVYKTPFVLGKMSGKVDGVIEINGISRMHARIVFENNRYFIEDLNSTNGTFLNMRELERGERAEIEVGDVIMMANAVLTFVDT